MSVIQGERRSAGWAPDDSTFGARLALIRQRMGWGNVKEAATACGLPTESWRTWERDNVMPRRIIEITGIISNRTGCDRWWLMTGERRDVNPSTGPTGTAGNTRTEPSAWKSTLTEKSARPAYPGRVRPPDGRPSGHPKFPILPPRTDGSAPVFARPSRRRRAA